MAHEFETGFFTTEPAWHGLGTVLDKPPTIEEAIKCAGLDWTVSLVDMVTTEGTPVEHKAVKRSSDGSILGVVGPKFRPLQNDRAFAWFQPWVESGAVTLEAAGALKEGRRVWVLAKIAGIAAEVVPGDPVERFLLLAHAHDGTLAIRAGFTDVRVVCQNTLSMAVGSSRLLKIKHTENAGKALDLIQAVIDVQRRSFEATLAQLQTLARYGCDDLKLRRYVREVFATAEETAEPDEDSSKKLINKIVPLYESGRGASAATRGTMWGAFNAVTEFLTHERGRSADNRLDANWFGASGPVFGRALDTALAMCG